MDGKDFDRLTRAIVKNATRRQAVKLFSSGAAGVLLGLGGYRRVEASYSRRCTGFVLSGGRSPKDKIAVDDYITVKWNDISLAVKQNGQPQGTRAGLRDPIRFPGERGDRLRIRAYDTVDPRRYLGKLYLHCVEGGEGFEQLFARQLPFDKTLPVSEWQAGKFFDEEHTI